LRIGLPTGGAAEFKLLSEAELEFKFGGGTPVRMRKVSPSAGSSLREKADEP